MTRFAYTDKALELQERFDTTALAAAELQVIVHDAAIVGLWPGAQFAVKVGITALITNCPRYIPRMQRLQASRYVPDTTTGVQPIPGWKRIDAIQGVLPKRDQDKADTAGGLISMDQWGEMVMQGDPLA